jgi:hypothetical protein
VPKHPDANNKTAESRVPFAERITCSVADAEAASGVSRSQLYLEMKNGRLEYIKRGTRRLVIVPSLLKMLDAS